MPYCGCGGRLGSPWVVVATVLPQRALNLHGAEVEAGLAGLRRRCRIARRSIEPPR